MHTRFAKFINLPELLSMFRTVADVQTADMLKLPRPTIEGGSGGDSGDSGGSGGSGGGWQGGIEHVTLSNWHALG